MTLLKKLISDNTFLILLLVFLSLHVFLYNINVAEWGDSYRILRASEFVRHGTYPDDEKRPPLLSALIALRPVFIDQITFARFVLFLFSLGTFVIFYLYLQNAISDQKWVIWGNLAFLLNNVFLYWSIRIMADVPFAFFALLTIYLYYLWKDSLTNKRLIFLGILCGIAILTRFEGYILFGSLLLGLFWENFTQTKSFISAVYTRFSQYLLVLIGCLLIISPYLYFRNPLTSSYLEESSERVYNFKVLATYLLSFIALTGILPFLSILLSNKQNLKNFLIQNKFASSFILFEMLLILAWPAAVPRLFVCLIPLMLLLFVLSIKNLFDLPQSKSPVIFLVVNFLLLVIYIFGQYYLKLQFLILDRRLFVIDILLQIILIYALTIKNLKLFFVISIVISVIWSYSIINMHRDIFVSVKNAAEYASKNLSGKIVYNDISSVSDWYLNYQNKKDGTIGSYYNTEKKKNLEKPALDENNIDYLLITNEHNTTMTLDIKKRPYLEELKVFEYKVNGQTFVTRLVKVL